MFVCYLDLAVPIGTSLLNPAGGDGEQRFVIGRFAERMLIK